MTAEDLIIEKAHQLACLIYQTKMNSEEVFDGDYSGPVIDEDEIYNAILDSVAKWC